MRGNWGRERVTGCVRERVEDVSLETRGEGFGGFWIKEGRGQSAPKQSEKGLGRARWEEADKAGKDSVQQGGGGCTEILHF